MLESRLYRKDLTRQAAAEMIRAEARAGKLDADAAEAVIAAAGATAKVLNGQGPLTDRELEALRGVARGAAIKQIAANLGISQKTVEHHLKHAYQKLDVATRAGAVMRLLERGLLSES